MGPEGQDHLLQEIGSLILGSVEGEWREIVVDFSVCHRLSTYAVAVAAPDGTVSDPDLPSELIDNLRELRRGMYREGAGTWFSIRYAISSDNQFHVNYEYDVEPDFGFEIALEDFSRDLEKFPRDEENIPDWLQGKLRWAVAGED